MSNSKPLRSTDVDGKELIIALRGGQSIYGINVDSFYWTPDGWVLIEFQKCISFRPHVYDLNACWYLCWRKYALLWKLTRELHGMLYILYYEITPNGYGDFKVHKVLDVDIRNGLALHDLQLTTFAKVRKWYNDISEYTASAFPFERTPYPWEPVRA
jgi:hypothetical protein